MYRFLPEKPVQRTDPRIIREVLATVNKIRDEEEEKISENSVKVPTRMRSHLEKSDLQNLIASQEEELKKLNS